MDSFEKFIDLLDLKNMNKDALNRFTTLLTYMRIKNVPWYMPQPENYRDYLQNEKGLSNSSTAAHIGAYRSLYKFLLKNEEAHKLLVTISETMEHPDLFLTEAQEAMEHATETSSGKVEFRRTPKITHVPQAKIDELFKQFDVSKPIGIRDAFAFGLIYCAGLNEIDLCALQVHDLKLINNELFVSIAAQTNDPARTIPVYDDALFSHEWIQTCIATYLRIVNVKSGFLMRGFIKGGLRLDLKSNQMTVRALRKMIHSYTNEIVEDDETPITALDLRRTYARRLFERGITPEEIGANLGHTLLTTTLEYIGQPTLHQTEEAMLPDGDQMLEALRYCWPHDYQSKLDI